MKKDIVDARQAGMALVAGDIARAKALASHVDDSPAGLLVKARIAYESGAYEDAVQYYHRMSDLEPAFERQRVKALAQTLAKAGRIDEATLQLDALLRTEDKLSAKERRALLEIQAEWLVDAGEHVEAVAVYRKALDFASTPLNSDRINLAIGRSLADAGETTEARGLLESLALNGATGAIMKNASKRLRDLGISPNWTAQKRLTRARRLIDLRQFDEALATIEPIQHRGSLEEANWLKARILYKKRRHYKEAIQALQPIAAGKGIYADPARFLLARALSRIDKDQEAIAAYHVYAKKTKNRSKATEARFLAARLAFYLGLHEKAVLGFEKLVGTGKTTKKVPITDPGRRRDAHFLAGLSAILDDNPLKAVPHLAAASKGSSNSEVLARNSYWLARARVMAKKKGAFDDLRAQCEKDTTSWYARMSAKRLAEAKEPLGPCDIAAFGWSLGGGADAPEGAVDKASPKSQLETIGIEKISRLALLFFRAGFFREAAEVLNREEKRGAVKLDAKVWVAHYLALDAPHFAIRQASAGLSWPPVEDQRWRAQAAYPAPYGQLVRKMEKELNLPSLLLYAIARKESLFNPNAVSRVGAMGMMQMMPRTYESNRKRAGLPPLKDDALPGPEASIRAAAHELANLLARFDGSLPLAIMAYNGGPHAVTRWLARSGGLPLDVFVEKAGFVETRNYVRRVMKNLVRYRQLHGEPLPELSSTVARAGNKTQKSKAEKDSANSCSAGEE